MFSGKSMAIALLLLEKCDCLKLWFGKPVNCKISAFLLLLLLHQVIVLNFSRLTNVNSWFYTCQWYGFEYIRCIRKRNLGYHFMCCSGVR